MADYKLRYSQAEFAAPGDGVEYAHGCWLVQLHEGIFYIHSAFMTILAQ